MSDRRRRPHLDHGITANDLGGKLSQSRARREDVDPDTRAPQILRPWSAEPGNLRYDRWIDQAEPGWFVLDELYRDADALAAHRASADCQTYLASIGDLAERSAFTLDALAIG